MHITNDARGLVSYLAFTGDDGAYYVVGNLSYPCTLSVWLVPGTNVD